MDANQLAVYNAIKAHPYGKTLNNAAISGIMGHIDAETGGSFNYQQKEVGGKGKGLFQFTGNQRKYYDKYRKNNKLEDSVTSQVNYFLDQIQDNDRAIKDDGANVLGMGNMRDIRDAFKSGNLNTINSTLAHDYFRPGWVQDFEFASGESDRPSEQGYKRLAKTSGVQNTPDNMPTPSIREPLKLFNQDATILYSQNTNKRLNSSQGFLEDINKLKAPLGELSVADTAAVPQITPEVPVVGADQFPAVNTMPTPSTESEGGIFDRIKDFGGNMLRGYLGADKEEETFMPLNPSYYRTYNQGTINAGFGYNPNESDLDKAYRQQHAINQVRRAQSESAYYDALGIPDPESLNDPLNPVPTMPRQLPDTRRPPLDELSATDSAVPTVRPSVPPIGGANVEVPREPVGTLMDRPVYSDENGEYVIGPNMEPIYLDSNQQASVSERTQVPISSVPATVTPEVPAPDQYNKYDLNKDGIVDAEEAKIARDAIFNQKPSGVGTPLDVMPSGGQIPITDTASLIARNEQILEEMIAARATPDQIAAQQAKIDRLKEIPGKQEAFGDVVNAQNTLQDAEDEVDDLAEQAGLLRAAGLDDRAEVIENEAEAARKEAEKAAAALEEANAAQDRLYPAVAAGPSVEPKDSGSEEEGPAGSNQPNQQEIIEDPAGAFASSEAALQEQIGNVSAEERAVLGQLKSGIEQAANDPNTTPEEKLGFFDQFKNEIVDMFSAPALANALVGYAGTLLFGGSHAQAGKQAATMWAAYNKQQAAIKAAATKRQQEVSDKLTDNAKDFLKEGFTPASVELYTRTGNEAVLKKGSGATGTGAPPGAGGTITQKKANIQGQTLPVYNFGKEHGDYILLPNGQFISATDPSVVGEVQIYDSSDHSNKSVTDSFSDYAKSSANTVYRKGGDGQSEYKVPNWNTARIASQANRAFQDIRSNYGVNVDQYGNVKEQIGYAIDDMRDFQMQNPDVKAELRPFIDARMLKVEADTQGIPSELWGSEEFGFSTAKGLASVDNEIRSNLENAGDMREYRAELKNAMALFNALSAEEKEKLKSKGEPNGRSAFSQFIVDY